MSTELHRDGDWAEFVVHTDVLLHRERLIKMGWRPVGLASLSRRLSATGDVERIFANFALHLEDMIQQSAHLRPVAWEDALTVFLDRTGNANLHWWLYGSGALAIRGLDITPGDLDLVVDDPWLVASLLSDFLVEPVTRMEGWVAEWSGRAYCGAVVEWLSGGHRTGWVPPHEQEPAAAAFLETVEWRGRAVQVPTLQVQLAVAERRGLEARCALIRRVLTE